MAANDTSLRAFSCARQWRGRRYLLSPFLDFSMAGGGALIVVLLFELFMPGDGFDSVNKMYAAVVAGTAFLLSFFVNYPHFMASYQLLYRDFFRKSALLKPHRGLYLRHLNAGLMVPLTLLLYFVYAYVTQGYALLQYSILAMFFFVGWHYVKQGFGVFSLLSALKGQYYSGWHRKALLINSYMAWLFSWVVGQSAFAQSYEPEHMGVTQLLLPFPPELGAALLVALFASSVVAAGAIIHHWVVTKTPPSVTALSGYLSMYFLLAMITVLNPLWLLVAPFFHSLQYLLFVVAYKQGEYGYHAAKVADEGARKGLRKKYEMFFGVAFLSGALSFYAVPHLLDVWLHDPGSLLPATTFLISITVFINIHHYFIDNVIWRKENTDVGRYVFRRYAERNASESAAKNH